MEEEQAEAEAEAEAEADDDDDDDNGYGEYNNGYGDDDNDDDDDEYDVYNFNENEEYNENDDYDYDNEINEKYIEPDVRSYTKIMSVEDCIKIINLGEKIGFPLEYDSIDAEESSTQKNTFSQAMDIYDEQQHILQPTIWNILKPYINQTAKLIINQRDTILHNTKLYPNEQPNRIPKLGWVFFRKYSPTSYRNSLIPHTDTNLYTVNIALNDNFIGGGLFYVKPPASLNYDNNWDKDNNSIYDDGIPRLKPHQYGYEWVNTLTHHDQHNNNNTNTNDIVFPSLKQGDALIHNYTVWHAVAPIETGTRYSLVLFFDMDNPMLKSNKKSNNDNNDNNNEEDDFILKGSKQTTDNNNIYDESNYGDDDYYVDANDNDDDEDNEDDELSEVTIKHEIIECINDKIQFVPAIDIVWVNQHKEEQYLEQLDQEDNDNDNDNDNDKNNILYLETIHRNMKQNQIIYELTDEEQIFRAVRSKKYYNNKKKTIINDININEDPHEREILAEIYIQNNKFKYIFKRINEKQILNECGNGNGNTGNDTGNDIGESNSDINGRDEL
jgi:hypothetical protein